MGFGFLSKKEKHQDEHKDTQDVKQAASSQQNSQQGNFVNPFQQPQNTQNMAPNFQQQAPPQQPSQEEHEDLFHQLDNRSQSEPPTPPTPPQPGFSYPQQTHMSEQQAPISSPTPPPTSDGVSKEEIQEMIDETVEKLIEEKWDKVVTNVEKVVAWKGTMENQMNLMKDDLGVIKDNFEKIEKKLMAKISDYDRDILDIGSEIKALEKVFQKITPTLVNNVNELSKITESLRGSKMPRLEVEEEPQEEKEKQSKEV